MTSRFEVMATIPADVGRGPHLIVATQNFHHNERRRPARASIFVGTDAPAPVALRPGAGRAELDQFIAEPEARR